MKTKINKVVFLCSIVMPIALFSGLREWLFPRSADEDHSELFNLILMKSAHDSVDEDSARRIFESGPVQGVMPKWYSLQTKIGFMKGFIDYSKDRFSREPSENKGKLANFCRVVSMATTYLGYLNKPWITGKDVALVSTGGVGLEALKRLKGNLSVLAAFTASVDFVLEHLIRNRVANLLE